MKKKRHSPEEIVKMHWEAEGMASRRKKVADISRRAGSQTVVSPSLAL